MDAQLLELATRQDDLVASWQLRGLGWTDDGVRHRAKKDRWRRLHRGVYCLCHGQLTRRQRWLAATLTAPHTYLSHASGGACHGFHSFEGGFEIVTRAGSGGRRSRRGLLVCRSTTLHGATTTRDGIPITTPERTLADLAPHLSEKALKRAFREAIRMKTTTAHQIAFSLASQENARGTALLRELAYRYVHLPYERTKSNAEALALEILHDARRPQPLVNVHVAGEEADLVWPREKRIVEIDGPQYHRFPGEDARKEAAWRRAGFTVERLTSDDVYDRPELLLALAPRRSTDSGSCDGR